MSARGGSLVGRLVSASALPEKTKLIDEEKVLKQLPFTMQVQLSVVLNQQLLLRVPLFKYIDPTCAAMIVLSLQPSLYLPYEVVLTESASNDCLFFVRSGTVEVIVSDLGMKRLLSRAPSSLRRQIREADGRGSSRCSRASRTTSSPTARGRRARR